jgi:hypothetical protein
VETKAHLCFLKKVGGPCGCAYGTKGAVDRKSLGTTVLETADCTFSCQLPRHNRYCYRHCLYKCLVKCLKLLQLATFVFGSTSLRCYSFLCLFLFVCLWCTNLNALWNDLVDTYKNCAVDAFDMFYKYWNLLKVKSCSRLLRLLCADGFSPFRCCLFLWNKKVNRIYLWHLPFCSVLCKFCPVNLTLCFEKNPCSIIQLSVSRSPTRCLHLSTFVITTV